MAQPETGTYSFESNNSSETGTVVITEISDNVYGVTYTPTGGDGSSQIMTKDVSGNLVASSGKFTIIEGQNSATPPAYKYGTTGESSKLARSIK